MKKFFSKAFDDKWKVMFGKISGRYSDTTSYLLKSSNNAARLLKSIEDYKKGLAKERSLIDE